MVNDYLEQFPNFDENQEVTTSIAINDIPIVEAEVLPSITIATEGTSMDSEVKNDLEYLSPKNVKVRRYVLRK